MSEKAQNLFREIPSVDRILNHVRCETLLTRYNREYVTRKCREIVDALRAELRHGKGHTHELKEEAILVRLKNLIRAESFSVHVGVITATGTTFHTTLGRAWLPHAPTKPMTAVAVYPFTSTKNL